MGQTIRRILIATDFSESSQHAQQYAVTLATALRAELRALHVAVDPAPLPSLTGSDEKTAESRLALIIRGAQQRLRDQMAADVERCPGIICEVRVGEPVREIKNYADTHDIDLIVLGTHGRTGLDHVLIGSVAEKLVRISTCPVLTAHPRT